MRFFADHCMPESAVEALEANGHKIIRLRNRMATDAVDPDVIAEAQQLDAILLSLNGDFSNLIQYPPREFGGIVTLQVKDRPELLSQLTWSST